MTGQARVGLTTLQRHPGPDLKTVIKHSACAATQSQTCTATVALSPGGNSQPTQNAHLRAGWCVDVGLPELPGTEEGSDAGLSLLLCCWLKNALCSHSLIPGPGLSVTIFCELRVEQKAALSDAPLKRFMSVPLPVNMLCTGAGTGMALHHTVAVSSSHNMNLAGQGLRYLYV